MNWKPISELPSRFDDYGTFKEARVLVWVSDRFQSGWRAGRCLVLRNGKPEWKIEGSNSRFNITHWMEVAPPGATE